MSNLTPDQKIEMDKWIAASFAALVEAQFVMDLFNGVYLVPSETQAFMQHYIDNHPTSDGAALLFSCVLMAVRQSLTSTIILTAGGVIEPVKSDGG